MIYTRLALVLFTLCCCFACQSESNKDLEPHVALDGAKIRISLKPDFSWASFHRFWHRGADEKVAIPNTAPVGKEYTYDFGHGVNLTVPMYEDLVEGVILTYAAIEGNEQGGRQFIRLMQHIMRLGGFQWDRPTRDALYAFYEVMSPQSKEFYFKRSYFVRSYDAHTKLWTFAFYFVTDSETLRTVPTISP